MKTFKIFYDSGFIKGIIFVDKGKILAARGFLEGGEEIEVKQIMEHGFKLNGRKYIQNIDLIAHDDSFIQLLLSVKINYSLHDLKIDEINEMLLIQAEKIKEMTKSVEKPNDAMLDFAKAVTNLSLDNLF